ncbi:hypothetical protein ACO1J2_02715 [Leptospira interrogans serovar Grippotyphosa]|nr:hypothetical protein [Leptospira interrogans]
MEGLHTTNIKFISLSSGKWIDVTETVFPKIKTAYFKPKPVEEGQEVPKNFICGLPRKSLNISCEISMTGFEGEEYYNQPKITYYWKNEKFSLKL